MRSARSGGRRHTARGRGTSPWAGARERGREEGNGARRATRARPRTEPRARPALGGLPAHAEVGASGARSRGLLTRRPPRRARAPRARSPPPCLATAASCGSSRTPTASNGRPCACAGTSACSTRAAPTIGAHPRRRVALSRSCRRRGAWCGARASSSTDPRRQRCSQKWRSAARRASGATRSGGRVRDHALRSARAHVRTRACDRARTRGRSNARSLARSHSHTVHAPASVLAGS